MNFRKFLFMCFFLCSGSIFAQKAPTQYTLKIEIETPEGWQFHTQQIFSDPKLDIDSKPLSAQTSPKKYQAIRCDGPWGAIKYTVSLSSGPGVKILHREDTIIIKVIEYSVDSKDQVIETMSIQCIDTEPTQIMNSVEDVKFTIDKEITEQVELSNGYVLKYHFKPG
ncbi:hypothetical protein [uncultured Microbulbifer sp.]|uniref:hypothetical protein n=1 Tax=uncultured Microbulbifer sp. TaxID=348147 RepID=UPI0026278635|nr:hypothetical protein [uncultured Microbulbifer sp.]